MSLRTKLLILSIILALIPLGISGRSLIRITRDELKDSANSNLIGVASQITQGIEEDFYYTWLGPLQLIRNALENENMGGREVISLLTESMKNITDIVALQISVEDRRPSLLIRDEFSDRLKKASLDPTVTLRLPPGRITALRQEDEIFVGDLTYLPEADAWLTTVILLLDDTRFGGPATLSARINLGRLKERVENHPFSKTGMITLVDPDGRKLFDRNRPDLSGQTLVGIVKKLLASERGNKRIAVESYPGPSGEKMLGAYAFPSLRPATDRPLLGVIVEQNESDAYRAVRDMEQRLLIWVIIGFSFAVVGAVVVSVSLTRPLRRLTGAARVISEGDLSIKIEGKKRKDEIGKLSQAFNKMVGDLREHIDKLTETTKAKERAESELQLAKNIQQSFLPKRFPDLPEIDVWGKCEPAREVGGDYFDFFQIDDDHYGMVIGDVSGKGAAAALFMAVSRTLFRTLSSQEHLPDHVLTEFNDRLVALDQGANMFITVFYGVFNTKTGKLLYSTAGHNMPYIKTRDTGGKFQALPKMKTMIAGMMEGMEMGLDEIYLSEGDAIVLYTDGMTEAINKENEEFGEDRWEELLNTYSDLSAREMCEKLIEDIEQFQTDMPQFDDMTMFIFKVKGGA
ncbi:SpoIIE family protein phosphatase [Desulfococcaceae bacterium HSG8]|nr:SpoIIE family protein phosphatase [Desulfococcaceae bacterium HSG8]